MPRVRLVRGSFDAKENFRIALSMVMDEARVYWKVPKNLLPRVIGGIVALIVGLFFLRPLLHVSVGLIGPLLGALLLALLALILAPVAIISRLLALRMFGTRVVNAEERELPVDEIEAALRDGRLTPQDLIAENGWKTLLESRLVGEAAEDRHLLDEKRRLITKVVLVPIGMVTFVAAGWLIMHIPEFVDWLAHYD